MITGIKSIALIALFAGSAIAEPLRNRLAQMNTKNLAQAECASWNQTDCNIDQDYASYLCPNLTLVNPCNFANVNQSLQSGLESSLSTSLAFSSSVDLKTLPGYNTTQIEQSECCSAEQEVEQAVSCAYKTREFCINGNICVVEKVRFSEESKEREYQTGKAQCTTFDLQNTAGSDSATAVGSGTIVCPDQSNGNVLGISL